MKILLKEGTERNWYLIEEWVTAVGFKARIQQGVWNDRVKAIADLLHDYYTGYVQVPDRISHIDERALDVHGGVTFGRGALDEGGEGTWIGFDMAHAGDENNQNLEYAKEQCELLAKQIAAL